MAGSKSSSGKLIVPDHKNGMYCHGDYYFSGGYLYFSYYDAGKSSDIIYRIKAKGTGLKKIKRLKQKTSGGNIRLVYGKNIYFCWNEYAFDGYVAYGKEKFMCRCNASTGKESYYKQLIGGFGDHYNQYYLSSYDGGDREIQGYILDAKTGKVYTIDKNAYNARIVGKKVYVIIHSKDYRKCYLYSCNLKGKNKKKLASWSGEASIQSADKKSITVSIYLWKTNSTQLYKYTIATGKLKKS